MANCAAGMSQSEPAARSASYLGAMSQLSQNESYLRDVRCLCLLATED